jgi:PP-loop superfamily ATP-utilizing enzyme
MKRTLAIIEEALQTATKPCIAFSGGSDSLVLLNILHRKAGVKVAMTYHDTR